MENNKALGRFIDLAMLNIGGYYVKENRMGTFGYLSAWTFSEDEEACLEVGWKPYHVTKGYDLNANTLTAASALQWGNNVTPATDDAEQIMTLMAWDITEKQQNGLGNTNPQVYRTIFITKDVAKDLAKLYTSKNALEDALIETARRPLWMRAYAHYWANTGSQQFDKRTLEEHYKMLLKDSAELAEMTDTPDWLKGIIKEDQIMTIATMLKGQTPLLITGDTDRNKFQVMPGGGYVTVEIRLPENWDELVSGLGYEPLANFYLDVTSDTETKNNENETLSSEKINSVSNGTYRLVSSLERLDAENCAYFDNNILYFIPANSTDIKSITCNLSSIIQTLTANCSFTVRSGKITAITLRPPTSTKKNTSDLSSLTADILSNAKLTIAITTRQSKTEGSITPSESSLILSPTLTSFDVDVDGTPELYKNNNDLITLNGSTVTINKSAPAGSEAQIIVRLSDGKYRKLTFLQTENGALNITYTTSGS